MCFYNECDWTADYTHRFVGTGVGVESCDECRKPIPVGGQIHRVYMQEHDCCYTCEQGECDCPRDDDGYCTDCECEEPTLGEVFDYACCDECQRFRLAIEAAEKEEGCDPYESSPGLGTMFEQISEGGKSDAKKYWRMAMRMFPEMRAWLAERWRKEIMGMQS